MKIDQIAYYARSTKDVLLLKQSFGLLEAKWIEDEVHGVVRIYDQDWQDSHAKLLFNYDLGIELEIIQYLKGPHWHETSTMWPYQAPTISHVGVHLDANEDFPKMYGWKLVQEMVTRQHTNSYVIEKNRRYHYQIFQQGTEHNYLKFIRRIENAG